MAQSSFFFRGRSSNCQNTIFGGWEKERLFNMKSTYPFGKKCPCSYRRSSSFVFVGFFCVCVCNLK